jgi:alkanesulfonate monooxygenase SsuD/methylene tetrahydromethanopterin reductase-like flavin-dependent oxidoreductase (luciferase family)
MLARPLHIAVALDGAGWHPAAWREADARPDELFSARYWSDLVQQADRALVDFVTIEDGFAMQSSYYDRPDGRVDQVRGRLDAVLIAARVAPLTRYTGLVPSVTVTHTEPFHISKAIATLDYVSSGRAGVRVQVSGRVGEAALFGRRQFERILWADRNGPEGRAKGAELFDEIADYVEVLRRLWDSWEDDAEIRDAASGRFVDREKLHYIDFEGRFFSVKGPSITPRPPQGQPLVTALAHSSVPYRFAARHADVVFVTPADDEQAALIGAELRSEQAKAGRPEEELRVFADLVVYLDDVEHVARDRFSRLDERAGYASRSDAHVFRGTPQGLATLLAKWQDAGLAGYRLRPGTLPHDLDAITRGVIPELQGRGLFRRIGDTTTLRGRLGLPRPDDRYSASKGTRILG